MMEQLETHWTAAQNLLQHVSGKKDKLLASPTPSQSNAGNTPDSVSNCSIIDKPHFVLASDLLLLGNVQKLFLSK